MKQISKKVFLYIGLTALVISFILKLLNTPASCFWILFGTGIFFKICFLIALFREKGFKPDSGLYFILTGVAIILISMLMKAIPVLPLLSKILFFSAITLKVTGLILMILNKRKPG